MNIDHENEFYRISKFGFVNSVTCNSPLKLLFGALLKLDININKFCAKIINNLTYKVVKFTGRGGMTPEKLFDPKSLATNIGFQL